MDITSNKQSGFSAAIGIIAIIIVIGVLGFIGWQSYNHSQPNTKTANATISPTNRQAATLSSKTSTASSQSTYLDIKELGIKMQLDDSIKDITYTVKTDTDGSQFAYISTTSLTNASKGSCSTANGGFASIAKASGTSQQVFGPQPRIVDNVKTFKFGTDTYVFITSPNGTCTQNSTVANLLSKQQATFYNDYKTVQLDQ